MGSCRTSTCSFLLDSTNGLDELLKNFISGLNLGVLWKPLLLDIATNKGFVFRNTDVFWINRDRNFDISLTFPAWFWVACSRCCSFVNSSYLLIYGACVNFPFMDGKNRLAGLDGWIMKLLTSIPSLLIKHAFHQSSFHFHNLSTFSFKNTVTRCRYRRHSYSLTQFPNYLFKKKNFVNWHWQMSFVNF